MWVLDWLRGRRAKIDRQHREAECFDVGHWLSKSGEIQAAEMKGSIPVPSGPASFWLYSCENKCGYTEANEPGFDRYYRSPAEAAALKKKGQFDVKKNG